MSARKKPRLSVDLAADGWRWTYRSENGATQAEGPKGYTRRGDCVSALRRVVRGLPLAEIKIGPGPAKPPYLAAADHRGM